MTGLALALTLKLAFCTAAVLMLVAVPIAYFIAYSRWRWKCFIEGIAAMPLVLPPTVLGFYLLTAMGSKSPIGRFYEQMIGKPLAFSFTALLIGSIIYSLPFAVQPLSNAFSQIDPRFIQQSSLLG